MRGRTTDLRGWSTSPRRQLGRRAVLLLIVLSVFGGFFTSIAPQDVRADDLDDAYRQQQRLQRLIKRQKASIQRLTLSQATLSRRIGGTRATLGEVNANLLTVKTQIVSMVVDVARSQSAVDELVATAGRLDAELVRIEADEARKQAELEASKAALASRIREAYDTDRTPILDTFLSGDDFTDVITEVGYQLDFAEQDKILADQIVADQQVLDVLRANVEMTRVQTAELRTLATDAAAALDAQMADLTAARKELARPEAETERLLAAQRAAYARMAADKAQLERRLEASRTAQEKLEKLIARLVREQLEKGGVPSIYNGTFDWPMSGTITQEFGCTGFAWEPPLGNCKHFHRAIDIATSMYTPIRAAGAGKVIFSGRSPWDPAWIVIIAHSSQLVSWYGHVDNRKLPPRVKAGDYVAKGDIIAYEGMTGWTTGPHLHWGVQLGGNWVNPRLFLPR